MLNGRITSTINTDRSEQEVRSSLENELSIIGVPSITEEGHIFINAEQFANSLVTAKIDGSLRKNEDEYLITVNYNLSFTTLGWVIFAICLIFYFVGILLVILPLYNSYQAKKQIELALKNTEFVFK
ncbi:MAG: hypothetical protein ACI8ZN_002246 [Bacteroidia bacterium]|jgi:hypothetical protein